MNIVFRTDASLAIGIGHIRRCLTLADKLAESGHTSYFICREISDELSALIHKKNHFLIVLPKTTIEKFNDSSELLNKLPTIDWLIVDHYQIDSLWEKQASILTKKLMVIDDLANRSHYCDLLLDQTPYRNPDDYQEWVPHSCRLLTGSQYAILSSEFSSLRNKKCQQIKNSKQTSGSINHILITLGGSNLFDLIQVILEQLIDGALDYLRTITVITKNNISSLAKQKAKQSSITLNIIESTDTMPTLMEEADIVISGCGVTLLERCCIGVPGIGIVVADNQISNAQAIAMAGAGYIIKHTEDISKTIQPLVDKLMTNNQVYQSMSAATEKITDGNGAERVCHHMEQMAV